MDGNAFSRTIINPRERPLSRDVNQLQTEHDRTVRDLLAQLFGHRVSATSDARTVTDGFIGDAFKVRPKSPAAMAVVVAKGTGFQANTNVSDTDIDSIGGLDNKAELNPIHLTSDFEFTVPTAPSGGQARIDIIMVKAQYTRTTNESRDVLNETTGVFEAQMLAKTFSWDVGSSTETINNGDTPTAALVYKKGTAATSGTEVAPSTDSGYIRIGAVRVGTSVTSIAANKLVDNRRILGVGGRIEVGFNFAATGGIGATPSSYKFDSAPGIECAIRTTHPGVANTWSLYIKAGGASSSDIVRRMATAGGAAATYHHWLLGRVSFSSTVTVDATLQGQLASATPPMDVAVGQELYVVTFNVLPGYTDGSAGTIATSGGTLATDVYIEGTVSILPQ